MLAQSSPLRVFLFIVFLVLFLASAIRPQKILDKWVRETGRKPMMQSGRGSWGRYWRSVEREVPESVKEQVNLWRWVAYIFMALGMITGLGWPHR